MMVQQFHKEIAENQSSALNSGYSVVNMCSYTLYEQMLAVLYSGRDVPGS